MLICRSHLLRRCLKKPPVSVLGPGLVLGGSCGGPWRRKVACPALFLSRPFSTETEKEKIEGCPWTSSDSKEEPLSEEKVKEKEKEDARSMSKEEVKERLSELAETLNGDVFTRRGWSTPPFLFGYFFRNLNFYQAAQLTPGSHFTDRGASFGEGAVHALRFISDSLDRMFSEETGEDKFGHRLGDCFDPDLHSAWRDPLHLIKLRGCKLKFSIESVAGPASFGHCFLIMGGNRGQRLPEGAVVRRVATGQHLVLRDSERDKDVQGSMVAGQDQIYQWVTEGCAMEAEALIRVRQKFQITDHDGTTLFGDERVRDVIHLLSFESQITVHDPNFTASRNGNESESSSEDREEGGNMRGGPPTMPPCDAAPWVLTDFNWMLLGNYPIKDSTGKRAPPR
uniref:Uncharacterized protein n=1 Tax=Chromera velia CCMP2878 TaxID=1169474 RepID=A0A0G4IFW5_9ALVE|eukprot:Cvel_14015.t1-p1 / transcript=Cvel_14015.t1 / gene=Cvel_14015 / organism=Chromera_velia_CCMP2878 / gene_product=hypothetical protein / transcript_product=hypothetical protein / location=Cvel_scaffold981:21727-23772(-) / protein_length=395 / sequence_SO=supercontig / SO=protein_coding / is_pseudo=false